MKKVKDRFHKSTLKIKLHIAPVQMILGETFYLGINVKYTVIQPS